MSEALAGWHALYLQALERRLAQQPAAVQALLRAKAMPAAAAGAAAAAPMPAAMSPLAELNRDIRTANAARFATPPGEPAHDPDELVNARSFRQAWDRNRTLDQVEHAIARKPAQAGPLNSHMLAVQTLAMMRELSPAYLRHFVVHLETLQWLEQASPEEAKAATRAGKPPRRARAAK